MTSIAGPPANTQKSLPDSWRGEVQNCLVAGETIESWVEINLDTRLHFAESLVIITNRRLLACRPGKGAWESWDFREGLSLGHRDHAGIGTLELVRLISAVLPPGVVNTVSGSGEVGSWLVSDPGIDKIMFTGSGRTGARIAEAAARNMVPTTMELGGNDAAIMLPDADPKAMAMGLFWGAFINMGQTCACAKRLYVHESIYDATVQALKELAQAMPMGNGLDEGMVMGPIQNKMQYDKVVDLVESAKKAGGTIVCGGQPKGGAGYFYPLTLVTGLHDGDRLVDDLARIVAEGVADQAGTIAVGETPVAAALAWLVLPVALWLAWVRREEVSVPRRSGYLIAPLVLVFGWLLYSVGDTFLFQSFWHLGAVVIVAGCALSVLGGSVLLRFWPSFAVLVFLVPVPRIVQQQVGLPMQAFTAQITAFVLDTLGTPIALSGSVLQVNGVSVAVAEACNGIRMLFALTLVCFLYAFSTRLSTWTRILIVLMSPFVAIAANVLRLVPTVWLYGYTNSQTADLFHDISGWAMMPVALFGLFSAGALIRWTLAKDSGPPEEVHQRVASSA